MGVLLVLFFYYPGTPWRNHPDPPHNQRLVSGRFQGMQVTILGPNLVQLTRFAAIFPINCYLVVEDDGLTLVDATTSSPADEVAAQLKRLGRPLRRLALTHAHGDHAGGVDGLLDRFPDVELSIGERDAPLLAGDRSLRAGEEGPVKGFFAEVKARPHRLLQPGDTVGSLEVVPSPGHTPGHVSFLDTRDRALLAGDALQTRGGIAVSGVMRPLFPFPAMATWHRRTALASGEALVGLSPSLLAVGHGRALRDPIAAMQGAIDVAHRSFGGS